MTCDTHPLPLQELVLSVKGLPRLARFLPKVMLALLVSASAEGYKKLAIWLNDMENYRLESAYEKHLIIKVVLVSGGQQAGRGSVESTCGLLGSEVAG